MNRRNRARIGLILAILAWVFMLLYCLSTPAKPDEPEPLEVSYPTHEELTRSSMLFLSDLDKPAAEPVVVICPYYDVPLSCELQDGLRFACEESGVEMELALAVIKKESGFQNITGDDGESVGYMQIQEKWHRQRMERLGVTDLTDPLSNFRVGCDYLAELLENYTLQEALTAYNTGSPGHSRYADTVIGYMEGFDV